MKLGARLRGMFHRREKLPPDPTGRRTDELPDPRLEADREDMRNRRSADAFGAGFTGGFGDGGGGTV